MGECQKNPPRFLAPVSNDPTIAEIFTDQKYQLLFLQAETETSIQSGCPVQSGKIVVSVSDR